MEIERRFLINNLSNINLENYKKKHIVQDYLYKDQFTAIRKRLIEENNLIKYVYTVKIRAEGISVNEIEKEISKDEYDALKVQPQFNTIDKMRYIIPYKDGLKIELDVFKGCYEGIIFAEIEFKSEEQAKNVEIPEWFGKELSCKITNSDMAVRDVNEILKMIKDVNL